MRSSLRFNFYDQEYIKVILLSSTQSYININLVVVFGFVVIAKQYGSTSPAPKGPYGSRRWQTDERSHCAEDVWWQKALQSHGILSWASKSSILPKGSFHHSIEISEMIWPGIILNTSPRRNPFFFFGERSQVFLWRQTWHNGSSWQR